MGRNRDNEARIQVGYEIDTQSQRALEQSAARAEATLTNMAAASQEVNQAANRADASMGALTSRINAARDAAQRYQDSADDVIDSLREWEREQDRVAQKVSQTPTKVPEAADIGRGASRLRDIGGGAAALGGEGLERATFVIGDTLDAIEGLRDIDIGETVRGVKEFAAENAGLIVTLGPVALLIGGIVAALALFQAQGEEARQAAERYADAIKDVNAELAAGGTSDVVTERIRTAQRDLEAANADIARLGSDFINGYIDSVQQAADRGELNQATADQLIQRILTAPLDEALSNVEAAVLGDAGVRELAKQVRDAQTAARDAAQDIESYTQVQARLGPTIGDQISDIDRQIALEQERSRLIEQGADAVARETEAKQADLAVAQERLEALKALAAETGPGTIGFTELTAQIDETQDTIQGLNEGIANLKGEAFDAAVALERQHEAEAAAQQARIDRAHEIVALEEYRNSIADKTLDQIEAEIEANDRRRGTLEEAIQALDAITDAEEVVALRREQAALQARRSILESARPEAENRDRIRAQERANEEIARTTEQAARDIENITEQSAKRRAEIEKQTADKIVDAVTKARDAAAKVTADLEQDLAKAQADAQADLQDEAKQARAREMELVVADQRQETRDLNAHLRNLQRIRDNAADREAELLLNGDFRALYLQRRDTRRQLQQTQSDFDARKTEQDTQQAQEISDLRAHYQEATQERRAALTNELAELRAAATQRLGEIKAEEDATVRTLRDSKKQQLSDLETQTQQELDVRRAAARAELQFLMLTEQQRLSIQQQAQAAYLQMANQFAQGLTNTLSTVSRFSAQMGRSVTNNSRSLTYNDNRTQNITTGSSSRQSRLATDEQIERRLRQIIQP